MQEAYDELRSKTPASPETTKMLGQRKADRYNEVHRDAIIDPRDHDFARPEQTARLTIVNPYSAMRGSFITTNVTFEELNANCPSANRPSFHPEEVKLDKLPNTNGLATVSETAKTGRELCANLKLTQMMTLSANAIQKFIDESSAAQ